MLTSLPKSAQQARLRRYNQSVPDPRELPDRQDQPDFDTSIAHPARVYDYWLGGKDNYAADREAAERVLAVSPGLRFRVRANRAFLARSVRYLAGEPGIRQFLDIGTGIPSANNTHEVAQAAAPDARIVYVDNDPIVLAHARALLTSTEAQRRYNERVSTPQTMRNHAEVCRFFDGLTLVPPGVVYVHTWRPDPGSEFPGDATSAHGGVGQKIT